MEDVMMMNANLFRRLVIHALSAGRTTIKFIGLVDFRGLHFLRWPNRAHATG